MKLQNISNKNREIYLFCREDNGEQKIIKDDSFFPYFFEKTNQGQYNSYLGNQKLKKIFCSVPQEVAKRRTNESMSVDILFSKRYNIDKIDKIEKSKTKYFFIDIETLSREFPNPLEAKDPISCITIYNSQTEAYKSWFLGNWKNDRLMLEDFCNYIKIESPDLLLSWNNSQFDFPYLSGRIKDLARKISPISDGRYGKKINEVDFYYPSGISIIDYLIWYRRIFKGLKSYSLDYVLEHEFGKGKVNKKVDFSKLSDQLLARNIEDVKGMVEIEKKHKIIDYYDEIRLYSGEFWENLDQNSRIIDTMLLKRANKMNLVLPNKPNAEDYEDESFEGAYRRSETGFFEGVYSADLSGAYPSMIIDFCLDPKNLSTEGINIDGTYFKQDQNTLLPNLAKELIQIKNELKKQKEINPDLQKKYDALKGLVNSLFGITGFKNFRLFDIKVSSAITFLVRDLLHYVEEKIIEKGYKIIYLDTDSIKIVADKDPVDLLNEMVVKWAKEKYNKEVSIRFDSEGKYKSIFILGTCHYHAIKENGKFEIKGIEAKRSSSSIFEAKFQEELIMKIHNKETKENILQWIEKEKERFRTLPLTDIGFPCKLRQKAEDYSTTSKREGKIINRKPPIFVSALWNTQKLIKFNQGIGSSYYYIYVKDDNRKENITTEIYLDKTLFATFKDNLTKKDIISNPSVYGIMEEEIKKVRVLHKKKIEEDNVLAFDDDNYGHIKNIDYLTIIDRCMGNKIKVIFDAMGWNKEE